MQCIELVSLGSEATIYPWCAGSILNFLCIFNSNFLCIAYKVNDHGNYDNAILLYTCTISLSNYDNGQVINYP